MSKLESIPETEISPNEPHRGEIPKPYFFRDEDGKVYVMEYIYRDGKDYLVPGSKREANPNELSEFEKKEKEKNEKEELKLAA